MLKFDLTTTSWIDASYSNSSGSLGGISVNPISTTDKYLIGDIDNADNKDEFF